MTEQIGWEKILATALISSFVTACLTEPVKTWIQRKLKRREMRRSLYWEVVNNFGALQSQVWLSKDKPEMQDGIGYRVEMGYKRLSYDVALKDPSIFYSFGHSELYRIDILYRDFEHVIHGTFESKEQRLRNAEFVVSEVLTDLKNRGLNKKLIFSVSPRWARRHFRKELPSTSYIDIDPPGLRERLRRRYDQVQYWIWGTFFK
ncbi:MAG: hypothetical protein WCC04_01285 [Terriglobales bacterium]